MHSSSKNSPYEKNKVKSKMDESIKAMIGLTS